MTQQIQTPELFLKPGANVYFENNTVIKTMPDREFQAYQALQGYRDAMAQDNLRVTIPQLLDYDPDSHRAVLSYMGDFTQFSPTQYFGSSPVGTPRYTRLVHEVAQLIRLNVPREAVPEQFDYENSKDTEEGLEISSVTFMTRSLRGHEPAVIHDLVREVTAAARQSQPLIDKLPLYAAHRDPNPNNMHVISDGHEVEVALVDWETFGLARVGYDEGRLMSHFALDTAKQDQYAQQIEDTLDDNAERAYFWRVSASRCTREAILFINGQYDSRLIAESPQAVGERKQMLADALVATAFRSLSELQALI